MTVRLTPAQAKAVNGIATRADGAVLVYQNSPTGREIAVEPEAGTATFVVGARGAISAA